MRIAMRPISSKISVTWNWRFRPCSAGPTTGLHLADIQRLLDCLQRLVKAGHSVLVIEHHLDVVKCADWILDLGPEGGHQGGQLIVAGTPEVVAACERSYTGLALRVHLDSAIAG